MLENGLWVKTAYDWTAITLVQVLTLLILENGLWDEGVQRIKLTNSGS